MASSHEPSSSGDGIFQTTDPFQQGAAQENTAVDDNHLHPVQTQADGDDDEEALRLAGVNSNFSFAASSHRDNSDAGRPRGESALSTTDRHAALNAWEEENERIPEQPEPDSALSPTAEEEAVDPRAIVLGEEHFAEADDKAEPSATQLEPSTTQRDTSTSQLEPVNSNINNDRTERGTDIFANVDPPNPQWRDESGMLPTGQPSRVAFASADQIDSASSKGDKEDSSDPAGSSNARRGSNMDDVYDFTGKVGLGRSGRNSVVIPRTILAYPNPPPRDRPKLQASFKGIMENLYRMAFTFPYWDMAFWSGWSYTWGSVLFVIDGVWAWGPVGWPDQVTWSVESTYVSGIFFFVGALLYQLGAVMAYLEAVNNGSFQGHAMKRFLEGHDEDKKTMLDEAVHDFFGNMNPHHKHQQHREEEEEMKKMAAVDPEAGWKTMHRPTRRESVYAKRKGPAPRRGGVDLGEAEEGESYEYTSWRWWPTRESLVNHHRYEIGYIACSIQLFGATLYSWCGLVSLHGISNKWTRPAQWYGGYWLPEVWGSTCFLAASFMFLSETQHKWYRPEITQIGWWIGFWAMIGSWGFLLNGIFGVVVEARPNLDWADFASECCTTWGSFGYLCSALCQWYAAVNKPSVMNALHGLDDRDDNDDAPPGPEAKEWRASQV